jgi:hypothetical protein
VYENDATLRAEFVRESLEIIAHVSSACARIQSSNEPSLEREEVDRGLHTLKGNAGALGYEEFSQAACHVLDQLRLRRDHDPRLSKREMSLVLRFVTVARQFLFLLSNERPPRAGFFSHFAAPSRPRPAQPAAKPPRAGVAAELEDERLAAEIEQILQGVPPLEPDPRRLLRRGRRSPAAAMPEAPPPPHPAPSTSPEPVVEEIESSPDPSVAAAALAGFGFEARSVLRSLASIPEDAVGRAWRSHLKAARDLLDELREASIRTRSVPIEMYLNDMARWGRRMAISVDDRLDISVSSNGVQVLPGVGDLLCMLLREVLDLTLPLRADDWTGGQPAIAFEARRSRRLELHVSGSPSLQRNTTREKIRLCATLQLLEEIGGSLTPGSGTQEVILSLQDDDLVDVPVIVVGEGPHAVALPAHRLVDVIGCTPEDVRAGDLTREGGAIPWMRRKTVGIGKPDAELHALVFSTAEGLRGLAATGRLQRRGLLVRPHSGRVPSQTLGFCISPEDGARIPLLPLSSS